MGQIPFPVCYLFKIKTYLRLLELPLDIFLSRNSKVKAPRGKTTPAIKSEAKKPRWLVGFRGFGLARKES